MRVIECKDVSKRFDKKYALNGLSLAIEKGKIVGLVGSNGAGKTTFLQMCAGYLKPTAGDIKVWGENAFDSFKVASNSIFIDEKIQFKNTVSLKEIIYIAQNYYPRWDNSFAQKLIAYFNININDKYKKLSRGMKTQFNIILGLCSRMPLTMFDEPTLGLDSATRKELYRILLKDYMSYPRTIIIASHLLNEFENLLEEVVLLRDGRLVLHQSIETLQNYGVMLSGEREIIEQYTKGLEVFFKEEFGNAVKIGVKNDFNNTNYTYFRENRIEVKNISTDDICNYLVYNKGVRFDEQ